MPHAKILIERFELSTRIANYFHFAPTSVVGPLKFKSVQTLSKLVLWKWLLIVLVFLSFFQCVHFSRKFCYEQKADENLKIFYASAAFVHAVLLMTRFTTYLFFRRYQSNTEDYTAVLNNMAQAVSIHDLKVSSSISAYYTLFLYISCLSFWCSFPLIAFFCPGLHIIYSPLFEHHVMKEYAVVGLCGKIFVAIVELLFATPLALSGTWHGGFSLLVIIVLDTWFRKFL